MSIRLTIMPAVFAGLLAAAPVVAQPAATPATAASPAPGATRRDAVVEHRIAELHAKLKITPAEQKPFDDFARPCGTTRSAWTTRSAASGRTRRPRPQWSR